MSIKNLFKILIKFSIILCSLVFCQNSFSIYEIKNSSKELKYELQQKLFYGLHQFGITTPQQPNLMIASFNVLVQNKNDLKKLFVLLTQRIIFLTKGGKIHKTKNYRMPPINSGILGEFIYPDNLTITVSVGESLFNRQFGLKRLKPIHLFKMNAFSNDVLVSNLCHGDIVLQICANTQQTIIHALRDIIKYTSGLLNLRWRYEGFISTYAIQKKLTPINLLGFKDGTANPNTQDKDLMKKILWITSKNKEPNWTLGGTYQVIRIIRFRVEFWDRTPLQEQEKIFGRKKYSGAPLGMKNEFDIPNYSLDPEGKFIPLNSHIRLAQDNQKILRRGYNYSNGVSNTGQLDMGLLFICFQNNLEKGFLSIQNKLNGEDLEEYVKPIGGGYFFVLPGIKDNKSYLGKGFLKTGERGI